MAFWLSVMFDLLLSMASEYVAMLEMAVEMASEFTLMLNILFIILLSFSMTREFMLYMLERASLFVLMLAMFVLTAS